MHKSRGMEEPVPLHRECLSLCLSALPAWTVLEQWARTVLRKHKVTK